MPRGFRGARPPGFVADFWRPVDPVAAARTLRDRDNTSFELNWPTPARRNGRAGTGGNAGHGSTDAGAISQARSALRHDRSVRAERHRVIPRSHGNARTALRVRRRHDHRRRTGSTRRLRQHRRPSPGARRGTAARDWRAPRAWRQPWTIDPAAADGESRSRTAWRRRWNRAGGVAHRGVRRASFQFAGTRRSRSRARPPHARLCASVVGRHRGPVRARARTARDTAGAHPRAQRRRSDATAAAAARVAHRRAGRPVVRAHPVGRPFRAEHVAGAAPGCGIRSVRCRPRSPAARQRRRSIWRRGRAAQRAAVTHAEACRAWKIRASRRSYRWHSVDAKKHRCARAPMPEANRNAASSSIVSVQAGFRRCAFRCSPGATSPPPTSRGRSG